MTVLLAFARRLAVGLAALVLTAILGPIGWQWARELAPAAPPAKGASIATREEHIFAQSFGVHGAPSVLLIGGAAS